MLGENISGTYTDLKRPLRLYRYVAFEALVDLVSHQQLRMTRIGALNDRFEGIASKEVNAKDEEFAEFRRQHDPRIPELPIPYDLQDAHVRREFYATCWTIHSPESADGWAWFGSSLTDVCLETAVERLCTGTSFDPDLLPRLHQIAYGNTKASSSADFHEIAVTKRVHFAHKQEIRHLVCRTFANLSTNQNPVFEDDYAYARVATHTIIGVTGNPEAPELVQTKVKALASQLCDGSSAFDPC